MATYTLKQPDDTIAHDCLRFGVRIGSVKKMVVGEVFPVRTRHCVEQLDVLR